MLYMKLSETFLFCMNIWRQNICYNNTTGEGSVVDSWAEIVILIKSVKILVTAIRQGRKHGKEQQTVHIPTLTKLSLLNSSICFS
jgi:hypothetical protein